MRATEPRAAIGAAVFARRVLRRHQSHIVARPPVAKVYRRLAAPLMIVRRPVQVRLAPTFNITVAGHAASAPSTIINGTAMTLPLRREAMSTLADASHRPSHRRIESLSAEQGRDFVDRLLAREERVAVQTSPAALVRALTTPERASRSVRGPTGSSPLSSTLIAPPVERVFRRSPVPVEAAHDPSVADGWGAPIGARRPAPQPVVDAAELDRVTDHVMRTLDRRVAAHRERHGRR